MKTECVECREYMARLGFDPTIRQSRWIMGKMVRFASPSNCEICPNTNNVQENTEDVQAVVKHVYVYDHSDISERQAARIARLENQYSSLKKIFNSYFKSKKVDKQSKWY